MRDLFDGTCVLSPVNHADNQEARATTPCEARSVPRGSIPTLLVVLACGVLACGDAAPPAPSLDSARVDGGPLPQLDASLDASVRGPDPVLPPVDVEIVLPYLGPTQTVTRRVEASTGRLDVHFDVDTTSSFGEEIAALQADLSSRIVPAIEARVDDVAFGVSRFEDFPRNPFGEEGDRPFELLVPITQDRRRLQSAIARLGTLGAGGDVPESGYEALFQVASGAGYRAGSRTYVPAVSGEIGGVSFRPGALHVVLHVTDAPSHTPEDYERSFPGTHGFAEVVSNMRAIEARVLGIASGAAARPHLEALAQETGAVVPPSGAGCATGVGGAFRAPVFGMCPLVFDILEDGSGLSDAVVGAVVGLLNSVAYDAVYGQVRDDGLGFVLAVEALSSEGEPAPERVDLRPVDGIVDTFTNVRFGTELEFALRLRNEVLPPADYDQIFHFTVEIVGDGRVLDSVRVRVIVPFGRLPRDAGADVGDGDTADAADAGLDAPDASDDAPDASDDAADAGDDAADAGDDAADAGDDAADAGDAS